MEKGYRIGACAVIFALLLRFACGTLPQKTLQLLQKPEVIRSLLFAQTGRWFELPRYDAGHSGESSVPVFAPTLSFSEEDAQLVQLQNVCGLDADMPGLLTRQLDWQLSDDQPTVLILHSHTSESYTYTGGYVEDTPYRTLDEDHNMLSIGQALTQQLEQAGICVIHDRTVHDYPSYNGSYAHARETVRDYLEKYPSIQLVLDLHRDAMEDTSGNQVAQVCSVNGTDTAKLMLVIGGSHEGWTDNMALAAKLQARLEQLYPGICRPIAFRSGRYNQDLSRGALLIEIGSAGNTRQQALHSTYLLGQAIIDLKDGTHQ